MAFTRSGDTLTLTRARKGTTASTHQQGDTVQLCYQVVGQKTQNIVYDLLVNYALLILPLLINPHGMLNKSDIYQDFTIH